MSSSGILVVPSPSQRVIITPVGSTGLPGPAAAQEVVAVREGQPPSLAILFWYEFAQAKVLDLANCRMRVGIAPAAPFVCAITSNGQPIGNWTVLVGQIEGVLTISQLDYNPGDDLQVLAPALQDQTLNDTLIIMALED